VKVNVVLLGVLLITIAGCGFFRAARGERSQAQDGAAFLSRYLPFPWGGVVETVAWVITAGVGTTAVVKAKHSEKGKFFGPLRKKNEERHTEKQS